MNTSCDASRKIKMRTYAWLWLIAHSSHQKYQKKKHERRFWVRPTLGKRKIYDWWTTGRFVEWLCWIEWGTAMEFQNFFCQAKISRIWYVFLVHQLTIKLRTLETPLVTESLAIALRLLAIEDSNPSTMYLLKVSTKWISLTP